MIVMSQKTNKAGKQQLTVVLDDGEVLLAIRQDGHYKLGYPVEDVMASHVLAESRRVTWCSVSQGWVE